MVESCRATKEEIILEKERETKDDGRYIIFFTFEDEESQESEGD